MADTNTLLLLHGEDLSDTSGYRRKIENSGVTVSDAQSKFGGKSLYFDGSSYLSITADDFVLGSGDFTIDWWQYRQNNGTVASVNVQNANGYSSLLMQHMDGAKLYSSYTGATWDAASGAAAFQNIQNTWTHYAVVRSGTTLTVYQNGIKYWSTNITGSYSGTGLVLIGCHAAANNRDYFKGYIDEFRISNVARWTSDFTPPDRPYVSVAGGASNIENGFYGISEGKTLVDGTAYTIDLGKVMVEGTAYQVEMESNHQEEAETIVSETWQKWSVDTVYSLSSSVSKGASGDTTTFVTEHDYIRYTTTYPQVKSGTFASQAAASPFWANSFVNTGIVASKLPYTVPVTGYYGFYLNTNYALLSDLWYLEQGTVINANSDGDAIIEAPWEKYRVNCQETKIKGTTQYENVVAEEGTYPDNGVSGDYWYVKIS